MFNFNNNTGEDNNNNGFRVVLSTTGAIGTGTEQSLANVFGVLSDVEAFGYNVFNNWSAVTPLNASGGYWVDWTHFTTRWFTDYTENGYVFLMD